MTDPRGGLYGYAYDGIKRLIRETDQSNAQVTYTLNAQGGTTKYTDPRTLATSYVRNGFGDVIQRVSPDTGTTVYTYDPRGLVTQMTDGRGNTVNYAYDNAGRMTGKTFPTAASENVANTYDSVVGGNLGIGRLTSVTDPSGATVYVYDARGNVLTETHTIGGQVYTVAYGYDLADHVIQITYPSGRIVSYTRDVQGRVTSVATKQNAAAAAVTIASGITWEPFSGLAYSMAYGNGLTELDTYSLDYEIQRLLVQNGATSLIDRTHARADSLNLTGIADAETPGTRGEARPYDHHYARTVVRSARRAANLPEHLTLTACRHGGITELGDSGLTETEEMSVTTHKTPETKRRYVKVTEAQRLSSLKKRRDWVDRQAAKPAS